MEHREHTKATVLDTKAQRDAGQAMRDGADTATAANSVGAYEEFFRAQLAGGKDLLHVAMSSGISGSLALTAS